MGGVVILASMWDNRYIHRRLFCGASLVNTKINIPNFMLAYESYDGGMCYKVCEKIGDVVIT